MKFINLFITLFISLFIAVNFTNGASEDFPVKWAWIGADCTNEVDCGEKTPPVGWISFDSRNVNAQCATSYKVTVDYQTGDISGYAFIGVGEDADYTSVNCSENSVGWLSFDSNETPPCGSSGYPSDYCFPARLERVTDGWEISGWAPIVSKDAQGNQTIVTWVRFKGSNYVVKIKDNKTISTNINEYWAWSGKGSEGGLGWIKFLPSQPLSIPSCSLSAQPSRGSVPLHVNFNLNIQNCNLPSVSWNGPCNLNFPFFSCNYTYNNPGTYGPYTATATCLNGGFAVCSSPRIIINNRFDLSVTQFNIRSFICKNNTPDTSYISEYLQRNPNYLFPPSTTAADEYSQTRENNQAILNCLESQINKPVEFVAQGECRFGNCPSSKLRIDIKPIDSSVQPFESVTFETDYNNSYPKILKNEYIFDNAYNYKVSACLVDQNNNLIQDTNSNNNCKEQTLKVYNYYCRLGFCFQVQRNNNPPLFEQIIRILSTTDAPCRFWRNQVCRSQFGF